MQSKKRFRETFIWEADFFMQLSDTEKLFWFYLNDRCDNIGVWEPNMKLAEFHIGSEINLKQFFERVNRGKLRLIERSDGSWLLTEFVKFQYARSKPLNPKSPAHKSYLELMKERNLWNWFTQNYPEVMQEAVSVDFSENSKRTLQELSEGNKEKDTDKDKATVTDKAKGKEKLHSNFLSKADNILKLYPRKIKNGESEFSTLALIQDVIEKLEGDGIKDPVSYLSNEIKRVNPKEAPPANDFFESLLREQEVPF